MTFYRILLGIDGIALGIAVFFFFWGMSDGTVSSFNIGIWMLLLGALGGVVGGGVALHRAGRPALAKSVLMVLALPSAGAALLVLVLILSGPNWH